MTVNMIAAESHPSDTVEKKMNPVGIYISGRRSPGRLKNEAIICALIV